MAGRPLGTSRVLLACLLCLVGTGRSAHAASTPSGPRVTANMPPHLDHIIALSVLEGGGGVITTGHLQTLDAESTPAGLTYTISPGETGPAMRNGTLARSGVTLVAGSTFTQADLDAGLLTYAHDGSETTSDDFHFSVQDPEGALAGDGGFNVFNFPVTITLVNDPPSPRDTAYVVALGASFNGTLRAPDPDSPAVTFSLVSAATHGTVTLLDAALGTFHYAADPGESGADTFTFQANDGLAFATAPGTITVLIANQPPVAFPDSVTTTEDMTVSGVLHAADGDLPTQALTFEILGAPSKGTATVLDPVAGTFRYVPASGAIGVDAFTFRAVDDSGAVATASVRVKIRARLDQGDIIVTDGKGLQVVLIDPATGLMAQVASGGELQSPRGVEVDALGRIDVISPADGPGSGLVRILPVTGAQSIVSPASGFSTSPLGALGLALESDGHLLVGDGVNGVIRVDPVSGATTPVASGGSLVLVLDVAVAPSGDLYVTDGSVFAGGESKVVRVDPVSGAQTVVSSGGNLVLPAGIAIEAGGSLLIADPSTIAGAPADQVLRVDPISGTQTVLSSGGLLSTPTGIAVAANGDIYIANQGAGNVLRVDPVSGEQSVICADPSLQEPFGIAVVPGAIVGVPGSRPLPTRLELGACAPNPVAGTGRVFFALPHEGHVRLDLLDVAGRRVATLVDRQLPPGHHEATIEARGARTGVYFLRLEAGAETRTRKVVLTR